MSYSETVLGGKFITVNAYIKKNKKSQINNLNLPSNKLEKERKLYPKQIEEKKLKRLKQG